jgi:hypothetical protein
MEETFAEEKPGKNDVLTRAEKGRDTDGIETGLPGVKCARQDLTPEDCERI